MKLIDFLKKKAATPEVKPSETDVIAAAADFIEVENYAGGTFHAVANQDRRGATFDKPTLCGYTDWLRSPSSQAIDAEKMQFDTTGRHWRYCPKCRDALIAIEAGRATASQFPDTSLLDIRKPPAN